MTTDDEDQKRIREEVCAEVQAVLDKHDCGGVVLICSRDSAAWRLVFPRWSGLQPDGEHGARLRVNSRTAEAKAQADSTLGMIANLRDMSTDVANLFGNLFRQAKAALAEKRVEVEHKSFGPGQGIFPGGRKGG